VSISTPNVWQLRANPRRIKEAALAWRVIADASRNAQSTVDAAARPLLGSGWRGDAATSYHEHRGKLNRDVTDSADAAVEIGSALGRIADLLDVAQRSLTTSLANASAVAAPVAVGDRLTFPTQDTTQSNAVTAEIQFANGIRSRLDGDLVTEVRRIEAQHSVFEGAAAHWLQVAQGGDDWSPPAEAAGAHVVETDTAVIVSGDGANDRITVSEDPSTHQRTVTVNGQLHAVVAGKELIVRGGGGNDTIEVPAGTNLRLTLVGGSGNDTITNAGGQATIFGNAGIDRVQAGAGDDWVSGGAGNDRIDSGLGDDTIIGGFGNDTIAGAGGRDIISGGEGDDTIDGGDGDDVIHGDAGVDRIQAGAGADRVSGGDGNDTIDGGIGDDTIHGDAGDDTLSGDAGDDTLSGGEGNDTITGGIGKDTIYGDGGVDSIRAGAGADQISGGEGNDTIDGGSEDDTIDGDGGDDTIDGSAGRDTISGGDGNDILIGGTEDDTISGGAGVDTIRAGAGKDTVSGGDGNDTIDGGTEDDTIYGDAGDDTITGGLGNDSLYGGDGADRINGGDGRDYIDGGAGNDILTGEAGDDTIYGMDGNDTIRGGAGNDYLEGALGDDTIDGDGGNDVISGGRGADILRGGSGSDRIYGGQGRDTVDAGAGTDTVYVQAEDSVRAAENTVTVELRTVGTHMTIEGTDEFRARVQADLDLLAASPRGQLMLAAMDAAFSNSVTPTYGGDRFAIREAFDENGHASTVIEYTHGASQTVQLIEYQPNFAPPTTPPVVVLFHEMAHVYDHAYGTLAAGIYNGTDAIDAGGYPPVRNLERVAVGLPVDHDNNPTTPEMQDPRHPTDLTENAMREEMGLPTRPHYRF